MTLAECPRCLPCSSETTTALTLDGVFEPLPDDENDGSGWLYVKSSPAAVQKYHQGNGVLKVRFESYRDLEEDNVPAGERVVVSIRDAVDGHKFAAWLARCEQHGHIWIPSIEILSSWSRVFLSQLCRWLPFTLPESVEVWTSEGHISPLCPCVLRDRDATSHMVQDQPAACRFMPRFLFEPFHQMEAGAPGAGRWAAIFSLARLLCRSESKLPEEGVHLRISGATQPLFPAAGRRAIHCWEGLARLREGLLLFSTGETFFVGDLCDKRLYEVSHPIAALLEVVERAQDTNQAARDYGRVVGCSARNAGRACEVGLGRLVRSGLMVETRNEF